MDRFNDLNIGQKLNIGFGILVLLLLLMVSLIFAAGRDATRSIDLTVDVRVPAALTSMRAQSNLLKMRAAVRGYLAVGDLQNIDDYNRAKENFQENLAQLSVLAQDWADREDVERLQELIAIFAAWLPLPEEVFALHDNPLHNQPALQLAMEEVQPQSVRLLADIEKLIAIQSERPPSPQNRRLLATMIDLQSSQQAMTTNLRAYAGTGDLVYKFGYAEQLVTNGRRFGELDNIQAALTGQQWLYYIQFSHRRERFLRLSSQLFAAAEGPKSHRDLFLFQQEMEPQTETMLHLLDALTMGQQVRLQHELNNGARRLAGVQYQTLLGGLLALVFGITMVYLFRESIAGPIHRLNTVAQQLGRGSLDVRATVEHGDEIGRLATTFNTMARRLRTVINELAHARDMAETANRAKSDFLARMSHELRTPLNGILGYVQILMRNSQLDNGQRHALAVIQDNSEHLLTLITDILDLSKIEAQKLELVPAAFALHEFLGGIVDMFRIRAAEQPAVQFVFRSSTELPTTIYADEKRVRQVLLNLLDNAFKFTAKGEISLSVTVDAFSVGEGERSLCRNIDGPSEDAIAEKNEWSTVRLSFTVADNGVGMSPTQIDKIFLPFEQVGDRRQRMNGTGLGLAIAHELAQAMQGDLLVSSELGVGSQFVFAFQVPVLYSVSAAITPQPTPLSRGWDEKQRLYRIKDTGAHPAQSIDVPSHRPVVGGQAIGSTAVAKPLPAPPVQEITVLLDMAHKGELPRLRKHLLALGQNATRYQAFIHTALTHIERFDEEGLLALLQQYEEVQVEHSFVASLFDCM